MISRRQALQIAATAALAVLGQSPSSASETAMAAPLPQISRKRVDVKQAVQRFDVFLKDIPTIRELQMVYSGPFKMPLIEKHQKKEFNGFYTFPNFRTFDFIGDVIRKCGSEPDWEATGVLRNQYYETVRKLFSTDAYDKAPLPVVVTKCGYTFLMSPDRWTVESPVDPALEAKIGIFSQINFIAEKYQFGPPDDATWPEKVCYGENYHNVEAHFVYRADHDRMSPTSKMGKREHPISGGLTKHMVEVMQDSGVSMPLLYKFVQRKVDYVLMELPSNEGNIGFLYHVR